MPAARKTANIIVNNYISSKRGVYRPDCTYETAKMNYHEYSHQAEVDNCSVKGKETCWPIYQRSIDVCIALSNHLIERSN